jgi:hypothetical protein
MPAMTRRGSVAAALDQGELAGSDDLAAHFRPAEHADIATPGEPRFELLAHPEFRIPASGEADACLTALQTRGEIGAGTKQR